MASFNFFSDILACKVAFFFLFTEIINSDDFLKPSLFSAEMRQLPMKPAAPVTMIIQYVIYFLKSYNDNIIRKISVLSIKPLNCSAPGPKANKATGTAE